VSTGPSKETKIDKKELRKIRGAYEKEYGKELRALVRGSGWTKSREFLVSTDNVLFFASSTRFHPFKEKSYFDFGHKPMILDEIFWDVFQLPENKKQPLSFRAMGAFTCNGHYTEDLEIVDANLESAELAKLHFSFAQEQVAKCSAEFKLDKFIADEEEYTEATEYFNSSASLFCAYCANNDTERAKKYALECLQHPEFVTSGFATIDKDFLEFGLEYLGEKKVKKSRWKFWE